MRNFYKALIILTFITSTLACESENIEPQRPLDEKAELLKKSEDIRGEVL
ncbi:hypothetical protein HH304_11795, partial [Flammeovirgaceae bacterium KN852]|nr:hypothetical protein [Marinigracilibium pacificum]